MGIKKYKPYTPSMRFRTVADFSEITKSRPEKALIRILKKSGGRNNRGRVTAWNRGGGHKRFYRIIDFKRDKIGIPARVAAIEYDPNRSARIALLNYADGEKRYILAPLGLNIDDRVESGPQVEIKVGNTTQLERIPPGSFVHNVEMIPGRGGLIARSAGTSVILAAKEGQMAHLRLPSGEIRLIPLKCAATIGQVGNLDHENIIWGKAGKSRWKGVRPSVRAVAKNPVDHPMGGGEGRSSGGRHPCTPWGTPTKGYKTRKKGKLSDKYIVKRRR